jgi:D-alanyl-D-alanine carboxypeptidase/D-alanyl-D-alanine-endopeptidase (penicillin-binding protein 4)
VPFVVVIVAVALAATLPGGARLVQTRVDTRPAGTVPTQADPTAALLALANNAPAPTARGLHAALDGFARAPALRPTLVAAVADVRTGQVSYAANAGAAVPPASTTKLVTAAAALTYLGADTVFRTRTLLATSPRATATVALVGGGDPTLAGPSAAPFPYPQVAHLTDLAKATAAALTARGITTLRVVVDDRLFSGPRTAIGWKPNYLTDGDVSPVTALSVDAGRLRPDNNPHTPDDRAADPTLTAGRDFVALLTRAHVHVVGSVRRGSVMPGSTQLASVSSPPVAAIVTSMLQRSDNDIAESLFRHIAIAAHEPGTFAGGAVAVRQWLRRLHVDIRAVQQVDGSGLSLRDRLSPLVLTAVLRAAADPAITALRPIVSALPVAGFIGTLATRYRVLPQEVTPSTGAGVVRAKTGTLTGVSALAGLVEDADGRLLAFAFVAPSVPLGGLTAAEHALDRLAARLSGCGCR